METDYSNLKEASESEIQELSLLLENRSFVDYFNVFLCLPVFGQHVFFNYLEAEFEFEPPIRDRRNLYLDRRGVVKWLVTERYRQFRTCPLFTEYALCMKLREAELIIPGVNQTGNNGNECQTFVRNVIGTVAGMLLFRESMRGTCGENVIRCWRDIEAWRHIRDPVKRMYWKHVIKTKYISQASSSELKTKVTLVVFKGQLNFDLTPAVDIPEMGAVERSVFCDETDAALLQLQAILGDVLLKYWLPRHLIRVLHQASNKTREALLKQAPTDVEYLNKERRLRLRFTFPTINQESNVSSPATVVQVSQSATDMTQPEPPQPSPSSDAEDEPDEDSTDIIEPVELLTLWGGPSTAFSVPAQQSVSSAKSDSYIVEVEEYDTPDELGQRHIKSSNFSETPDELGKRHIRSRNSSETPDDLGRGQIRSRNLSTPQHARSPIPIVLKSFLGGKKRTILGKLPNTNNRVLWSLASDILACSPFRSFLEKHEFLMDLKYLNFWTDVRSYLDTDENAITVYGETVRNFTAQRIVTEYLSNSGVACDIFTESLKMSLLRAITGGNDVTLLCMAQDIVQETLWEPLKLYIQDERRLFLKQVRGERYQLSRRRRRQVDMGNSRSKSALEKENVDPFFFFQCQTHSAGSTRTGSSYLASPTFRFGSATSRPATSYNVCISEEQLWKAMELAVLCCEYGTPMMVPQSLPSVESLPDILYSDHGSMYISRVPAVRNEFLHALFHKPTINIETIKVSRHVIFDKVDTKQLKTAEKKEENLPKINHRMVLRRCGVMLDRPTRPKSFVEVLTTPQHFDFFKRFMMVHKMPLPIAFWRAVEDLRDLTNAKTRQIRVTQIVRKFFGRYSKNGDLLDCDEDIIRQIPNMDKVTPGILICAQAAVYRSMERNWYPLYVETFPPETEPSVVSLISSTPLTPTTADTPIDFADIVIKSRNRKRKGVWKNKTVMVLKNLLRALVEFNRAVSGKTESQLLEIFMKCEVEKGKSSQAMDQLNHLHNLEKHIMSSIGANVQMRVVIRNRLVILNRLPNDLRFWIEVNKYQQIVDTAVSKGSVSELDTEFMSDKARSIIACFLLSEVPPKVQINIPSDLANNIVSSLNSKGPSRGLFHDAVILLFPILYHYYKRFTEEWMKGDIPEDFVETFLRPYNGRVTSTPHKNLPMPDYTKITEADIKTTQSATMDESTMKIQFSLSDGCTMVYPKPRSSRMNANITRRMTNTGLNAVLEETSHKIESKFRLLPVTDKRSHHEKGGQTATAVAANISAGERRKSVGNENTANLGAGERNVTVGKEDRRKAGNEKGASKDGKKKSPTAGEKKTVGDKARRLSQIVESLNQQRAEKINEQNRRNSKNIKFGDVVTAAMAQHVANSLTPNSSSHLSFSATIME
ncbi:uncharacterized protein LOC127881994 isoform X1 [Dreissena polymorpha]|uniref:uncharacterized protein LOC127881994 isoform X1 n=1 Tax=Dreissena polymorpha TaxID=45954 RepID=UPI002264350D|nr:uncharacterized protein LOC127881994 isoform X1 [Dreissena polymorpha]